MAPMQAVTHHKSTEKGNKVVELLSITISNLTQFTKQHNLCSIGRRKSSENGGRIKKNRDIPSQLTRCSQSFCWSPMLSPMIFSSSSRSLALRTFKKVSESIIIQQYTGPCNALQTGITDREPICILPSGHRSLSQIDQILRQRCSV